MRPDADSARFIGFSWQSALLTFLLLAALPTTVQASILYRMSGATCTSSFHEFLGSDPKLCNDSPTVEIRMTDTYVPGTFFFGNDDAESFFFDDGFATQAEDFVPCPPCVETVYGQLPSGPMEDLVVAWVEGYFFRADNGHWLFGYESGSSGNYISRGDYEGWVRVPAPPTLGLLALGLIGFSILRKRPSPHNSTRWST